MLKYILLISLLLVASVACTAPSPQPQTMAQETQEPEHDDHSDDHDDHDGDDHDNDHDGDDHDEDSEEHSDDHDEEDHREHEAHEHGAAELMIAWSGNELAIDLQSPAYNVLGFEYTPSTDAEKTLLDESISTLEGGEFLQFSPDASCTIVSAAVETELTEEAHEGEEVSEAHEGEEDEETHSDIDVTYNIQCEQPDNLDSLDVSMLFAQFPNFEDLRVQWISDAEQSAASLTPNNSLISFK